MMNARRERALVPANYGVSRNDDGLLTWDWVDERVQTSLRYWICSIRPDCVPHVRPLWGVYLDETLYFDGRYQSRWFRNLSANPIVTVHLEDANDAVILEGRVEITEGIELAQRIADAYAIKYPPYAPDPDPGGFALHIHQVYAWRGGDVENTATRWIFD